MKSLFQKTPITLIAFTFCFLCSIANADGLPAFPGAEGFGANSVGGRGGKVIKVTNLNDSGTGSFRAAAEASEARIVIFDVSGTIIINSPVHIYNPYITIAGETSPGGIAIAGHRVDINTHDVIVRHMRFRVGTVNVKYNRDEKGDIIYYDQSQETQGAFPVASCQGNITTEALGYPCAIAGGVDPGELDSFILTGKYWGQNEAYNIIIDHCSVSWGVDESFSITGGIKSTTVQWSIISEGLSKAGHEKGEHSKGLMISGKYRYDNEVSIHHNYIAHNVDRSPLMFQPDDSDYWKDQTTYIDGVNNISYDWKGGLSPLAEGTPYLNWVNNYAKPGPNSHPWSYELTIYNKPWTTSPRPLLYVKGNIGSSRLNQSNPDWNVGWFYYNELAPTTWRKDTPWEVPPVTTSVMSDAVAACILSAVGATAPVRDSVDERVINDFFKGTGTFKNNVTYPDDYPVFATPNSPVDTDNDGMPDSWEVSHGLNKDTNDSAEDQDGNGYTNIEEYLHYLSAQSYNYDSTCMSTATPVIIRPPYINSINNIQE